MLTNVTVSADDTLIKRAKEKAKEENKTIDRLFNEWLSQYTQNKKRNTASEFDDFMTRVKYVSPGRAFSREEMNAR